MHTLLVALTGLACALLWLVLLVVTSFDAVVVSGGLLGALYVLGSTSA